MKNSFSRRNFFYKTMGLGTGAFILRSFPGFALQNKVRGITPLIITSHTNRTGQNAMEAGWEILKNGGFAVDAVEKAANIIEVDPGIRVWVTADYPTKEVWSSLTLHSWTAGPTQQVPLPVLKTLKHLRRLPGL